MYHVIDRSILFPLALLHYFFHFITSSTLLGSFCNTPKKPCRKRKRESLSGMDYKKTFTKGEKFIYIFNFT